MGRKIFNNDIWIEVKRLFVYEGSTASAISQIKGMPTPATILKKAKEKNPEGLDWYDEQKQFKAERLELLAPGGMTVKILKLMEKFLSKDIKKFSTKDADALSKLHKSFMQIADKRYHIHMMFEVLGDYLKFLNEFYPELVVDGKIFNSARNFKNQLLTRLGEKF